MSVQPRRSSCCSIATVTPNAGRITTSSAPSRSIASPVVAQELDAHRPQLFVDVRVVNDLAGQVHRHGRKALARLIRVVDGAIDAVAEAELAGEMHGEATDAVGEVVGLDAIDDLAVIALGQHAGDGILEVEAFAEDQGRQALNRSDPELRIAT